MPPTPDTPPPMPPAVPPPPPWLDAAAVQSIRDVEHLRLLSIFHYIVGGLAILFSSFFLFHVFFGFLVLSQSHLFENSPLPPNPLFTPAPTASPAGTAVDPTDSTPAPSPTLAPRPAHRPATHGDAPPAFMGYLLVGVGCVAILIGWTVGALLIYSGRCLSRRTHRVYSMVMAGISCLQIPFGTILGVFTLVVLQRPTVKALYDAAGHGQR